MAVTNTGVVLRTITGVHDANFVHPLGDELIVNSGFDEQDSWYTQGVGASISIGNSELTVTTISGSRGAYQNVSTKIGTSYRVEVYSSSYVSGALVRVTDGVEPAAGYGDYPIVNGVSYFEFTAVGATTNIYLRNTTSGESLYQGASVKEILVNRESTTTNTGIVERSIVGVHDANFVHPIGDEEVLDGGFDDASKWTSSGWVVSNSQASCSGITANLLQSIVGSANKTFRVVFTISNYVSGSMRPAFVGKYNDSLAYNANGKYTAYISSLSDIRFVLYANSFDGSVDNVSVKEMLVNRESTTTNTGIVERSLTGVNESDLWLDSESTSVVNNTGIVERPITGVNESDPMFPDNTISNIVNIAGLIGSLIADLKARATTFENEEATRNILINLQKC